MHTNQQIMQVFQKTMHLEITNPIKTTPHSICLELPNHQQVLIGIIMTTAPLHNSKPFTLATKCQHTYHYLHQNDYTSAKQLTRFTLQSVEDCRAYIDDICQTLMNVKLNDCEITLHDGSTYLITITKLENFA